MTADRCFASVMLDEELWRSLAAIGADHQVAWVHGCALEHGHGGEHRALAYRDGGQDYWVQWDEKRKPRLDTAVDATPPAPQPAPPPTLTSPASASAQPDSPTSVSQTDALWAIAAALERLADVIAAAFDPSDKPGRHSGRGHSHGS
ncbi:hypothetical protein [Mycobacterium branderi]|uniref:Uncharacterized protein n=2 Tax=Mycobacterium branderi TaxID=43348 RepID=A0AA91LWU5_9MYCO|nr:hypothetical protein [Mycobacterium branderi]MCV7231547.1 hypothetical protein [Mycobacterium branderi]ORA37382.1 hypothetical protein BST20_13035 [Mycobacterium branderi]